MSYLPLVFTLYSGARILILLFSLWLTFKMTTVIGKRNVIEGRGRINRFRVVYVFIVVYFLLGLALGLILALSSKIYADATFFVQGDYYNAKVVSYDSHQSRASRSSQTMYTPVVEFQTRAGENVLHKLSYSTSTKPQLGDRISLFYKEKTNEAVSFGFITTLLFLGSCLLLVFLLYLLWGALLYATDAEMQRYNRVIKFVGLCIIIPAIMIFFEGLLIYALFYGNKVPWYVSLILVLFILILMFGIWGYIKMIMSNDIKWVRTGRGSWSGVAVPKESAADKKRNTLIKRK